MHINTTHWLKLITDWQEKERGIGQFQSYFHIQNTTHLLELIADWEEKGRGIGPLPVIHAHIKHNSPPGVDNRLGGERERHHFQSYIHTKCNLHPEVFNGMEKRHWSLPVIHTQKTSHQLRLIVD